MNDLNRGGFIKNVRYSAIVPVYNSEQSLNELHSRLVRAMSALSGSYEIIYIEDCGFDSSWQILKKIVKDDGRVMAIQLMHNSGQGVATICGLAHASGQFCITLDDDLQHPPEEISKLTSALELNDNLDVVIGIPLNNEHGILRRSGSGFVNWINRYILHKHEALRLSGFRVMRGRIVDALLAMRFPYPAIGSMLTLTTRRVANVAFKHEKRKYGSSNYGIRSLGRMFMSNIIGYSMFPLHMLTTLGLLGILVCVFFAIFFLLRFYLYGVSIQGWTSLMLVLVTISGFNFFAFSIFGEYMIRLFRMGSVPTQFCTRQIISGSDFSK